MRCLPWPKSAQWASWIRTAAKLLQRPDYHHESPDLGVSRNHAHEALERERRREEDDADRTET
jgi:hypothetical protein